MTSFRKIEANRRNARFSTGPSTAAGRARARRNALKTGLYARTLLLPGENADAYARLRVSVYEEYAPSGAIELGLVELVIADLWRLDRFARVENEYLEQTRCARPCSTCSQAPGRSLQSFLGELQIDSFLRAGPVLSADGGGDAHHYSGRTKAAKTDRCGSDDAGDILLDAFVSPVSAGPMEDIARQRRQTTREFLRNLAALEALRDRRKNLLTNLFGVHTF